MKISHKSMYLMINAAVALASIIQLVRGYKVLIVAICALTFLFVGNVTVYLAGSKARAAARQRKRDYYAG